VETAKATLAGFNEAVIRAFVADLYRMFLNREPDPVGLDIYFGELKKGMPVADVVAIFSSSPEFSERTRKAVMTDLAAAGYLQPAKDGRGAWWPTTGVFPEDYSPPGEAGYSYLQRLRSGFFDRYCSGPLVVDVGFSGYENPGRLAALPNAIGVDLDYPGYDGLRLPFGDGTVDTVFSSHCLEHILYDHAAIQDWYRVLKTGGFIVCMVPSQALYEKRRFLPSHFNEDHKRMYTPASLLRSFEEALAVNSYRVRHAAENDRGFDYTLGPEIHSERAYEIELVVEKIKAPSWVLA